VASYRTWQSLGRQVQKGEKGITIICPITVKTEDEVTKQPVEVVRGFTTGSVFDTLSRDSDGHTAARHESVRECRAASHAAMVG